MTTQVRMPARSPAQRLATGRPLLLSGIVDGAEGLVLADLARAVAAGPAAPAISLAVICRDGPRMATLSRSLAFFAPDIEVLEFPAWDCLPYDRVSPHATVVAQRMMALARLARVKGRERPAVLLTAGQRHSPAGAAARDAGPAIAFRRARKPAGDVGRHRNGSNSTALRARYRARGRRLRGAWRHRRSVRARHGRPGAARFLRRYAGSRSAASIRKPSARPRNCARSIWCRWRNSSSPPTPSGCFVPAMWRPSARRPLTTCSTKR